MDYRLKTVASAATTICWLIVNKDFFLYKMFLRFLSYYGHTLYLFWADLIVILPYTKTMAKMHFKRYKIKLFMITFNF